LVQFSHIMETESLHFKPVHCKCKINVKFLAQGFYHVQS